MADTPHTTNPGDHTGTASATRGTFHPDERTLAGHSARPVGQNNSIGREK